MQIEVHCGCGRRFSLPAALAGRQVRCPSCDKMVEAPTNAPVMAQVSAKVPPRAAPIEQVSWAEPQDAPQSSGWAVVAAVVGVGAIMLFGFVAFLVLIVLGFRSTAGTPGVPIVMGNPATPVPFYLTGEMPKQPLELPRVRPMQRADLEPTEDVGTVEQRVLSLHLEGRHEEALPLQYWVVNHSNRGEYNMACIYAMMDDPDAAFYWLQESFANGEYATGDRQNSVSADWAGRDSDLQVLWEDGRWAEMSTYMSQVEVSPHALQFEEIGTVIVGPTGPRKRGGGRTLIVALHGPGQRPEDLVAQDKCQKLANDKDVQLVAPPGPMHMQKNGRVWSRIVDENYHVIETAIAESTARYAADEVVLLGFSQGANVAAELIAAYPDRFRGAILLSPTDISRVASFDQSLGEIWSEYRVIVACNESEHENIIGATDKLVKDFAEVGAHVKRKTLSKLPFHELPGDLWKQVANWVDFLRNEEDKPSTDKPSTDEPTKDTPEKDTPEKQDDPANEKPAAKDAAPDKGQPAEDSFESPPSPELKS